MTSRIVAGTICGVALLALAKPTTACAQTVHVSLAIRDTGIILDARNATLQRILEEWQRVGGVRVMNLDKIRSEPITVLLKDVTEREALETLFRDLAGYVMSARPANEAGLSAFSMIVLVPASGARSSDETMGVQNAPAVAKATPRYVEEPGEPAIPFENVIVPADQRPPTPVVRQPPAPGSLTPFGGVAGVSTPGRIVTGEAPAGLVYPRVTNPDVAQRESGAVQLK